MWVDEACAFKSWPTSNGGSSASCKAMTRLRGVALPPIKYMIPKKAQVCANNMREWLDHYRSEPSAQARDFLRKRVETITVDIVDPVAFAAKALAIPRTIPAAPRRHEYAFLLAASPSALVMSLSAALSG